MRNENGDSIAPVSCFHDGMGSFDMVPVANGKYYVTLNQGNTSKKFNLPAVAEKGLTFRITAFPTSRRFQISQQGDNIDLQPAYIVGQIQHHVVFTIPLNPAQNNIDRTISTKDLNSGILQLTVFNKNHIPIAERLTFIDNKEYRQKATLTSDTINFSPKSRNRLSLSFPDTVMGSFSVAITDPEYETDLMRSQSIISSLLLTSDLKGYVNNPVYYFDADPDSARIAADILMMTHGWRRFKWTELSKISAAPLRYPDPGYISIGGKIQKRDRKAPLADKDLFAMVSPVEDSTNSSMQFIHTDAEGRFQLDSLIFFGKSQFLVSDIGGKKGKWLDIHPDSDSLYIYSGLSLPANRPIGEEEMEAITAVSAKIGYDFDRISKEKGELLKEVVLKVRKKTPLQELEEKYTSGLFGTPAPTTIDLMNTTEKIWQNNILTISRDVYRASMLKK